MGSVCASGGKKSLFFGKFDFLCFLVTPGANTVATFNELITITLNLKKIPNQFRGNF